MGWGIQTFRTFRESGRGTMVSRACYVIITVRYSNGPPGSSFNQIINELDTIDLLGLTLKTTGTARQKKKRKS